MLLRRLRPLALAAPLALSALAVSEGAQAFCGFYVAGADKKLFNNATMVVLMREGTRTVLSMQNNYQGPPENFAMVVPVPVVLQKENVKTLPDAVFDKVDQLASPRLVEYWEQNPCPPPMPPMPPGVLPRPMMRMEGGPVPAPRSLGVKIEAQFTVGEYEIVILSAQDSLGLDTWLRQGGYKIPDGAEPLLRPYVQAGSKFFVAKVDSTKVRFDKGMAKLSPLRFHYDTDAFNLPVRLGLVNSAGTQDLIVHILARGQRYELANYKNVAIPTNLDVSDKVRTSFGAFYAALFDKTLEEHPGAVVTEYSWDAGTCDPCPGPTLDGKDLGTLGADVLPSTNDVSSGWTPGGFVLTRLHARYSKASLGEDLIFRTALPIQGGREIRQQGDQLETGAKHSSSNNFQGRYAIRHPWKGPIACKNPIRGIWGGPPAGKPAPRTEAARDLAFAPRGGVALPSFVKADALDLQLKSALLSLPSPTPPPAPAATSTATPEATPAATPAATPTATPTAAPTTAPPATPPMQGHGCGACAVGEDAQGLAGAVVAALGAALTVTRRRRR